MTPKDDAARCRHPSVFKFVDGPATCRVCGAKWDWPSPAPPPSTATPEPPAASPARGEPRPEVLAFAGAMEAELRENEHKGGWEDCGTAWLLKRMTDERRELTRAVERMYDSFPNTGERDAARASVLSEAADVANFCMMIADVCGALPAPNATVPHGDEPPAKSDASSAPPEREGAQSSVPVAEIQAVLAEWRRASISNSQSSDERSVYRRCINRMEQLLEHHRG